MVIAMRMQPHEMNEMGKRGPACLSALLRRGKAKAGLPGVDTGWTIWGLTMSRKLRADGVAELGFRVLADIGLDLLPVVLIVAIFLQ